MRENSGKSYSLIANISRKLNSIRRNGLESIKSGISAKRTVDKVERKLARWVEEGKHHETDKSMDDILEELGLTGEELSFYCSRVLKKKFLTWRKELRINDAKDLLLMHPNAPACHIGFVVGLCDKSNFRQQFREVVGCTPLEWRKRNLKEYDCNDTKSK